MTSRCTVQGFLLHDDENLSLNLNEGIVGDISQGDKNSPPAARSSSPFLPVNIFSVPAILSHISHTDPGFIFTFLHHGRKHQAVLMETFLTALEKEGIKITWKEARSDLKLGCQATVDVTQVKPASVEENWLVFGLYLPELSTNITPNGVSSSVKNSFGNNLENKKNSFGYDDNLIDHSNTFSEGIDDSPIIYPYQVLNQTFTLEEDPHTLSSKSKCGHKYETGVVVVSISSQYLHLLVQLGDIWARAEVDPMSSMVVVDGVRSRVVFNVKMGAIGTMVFKHCVQCHFSKAYDPSLGSHMTLLWFGDEYSPSVRGCSGMVVGKENDKVVVQVEGTDTLVLFFSQTLEQKLQLQTGVLVWAWSKQLRGEGGTFLEGAAIVLREDWDELLIEENEEHVNDVMELSTEGIFSPIRSNLHGKSFTSFTEDYQDILANKDLSLKSVESDFDILDESLSVSFGSMSETEDQNGEFSMLANPDLSNKYMQEISFNEDEKLEMIDLYFQSLFWRSSSPKPDAVIDVQFDTVLDVNDLLHTYNDLVDDYDELVVTSDLRSGLFRHSQDLSSNIQVCEAQIDKSLSLLDPAGSITIDHTLVRKMSQPPLSPIPEEAVDGVASLLQDHIFTGPYFASTPSGRYSTRTRSSLSPSGSPSCGDGILSSMDSGYYESSFSGSNTSVLSADASPKLVRNILDQFLQFTQVPGMDRAEVINSFIAKSYKETEI